LENPFYCVNQVFEDKHVVTFLNDSYNLSSSHKTRDLYKQILHSFDDFCKIQYDKNMLVLIHSLEGKPISEALEVFLEYKRYLDNHLNRYGNPTTNSTKRVRLSVLKGFFRSCGIKIHHEDIREYVKIGRKMRVQKFALDQEIISKIIEKIDKFEFKTLTVLLASTGMRVMEAITLQPSDFDFGSNPVAITISAKQTKTNESRTVYLTSECNAMIEQLIRTKPQNQRFLFGKPSNPASIYVLYGYSMRKALRKLNLHKILDNGFNQITIHSFRSFFRTYAGHLISRDFAESFIGHRFYLSEYENMPVEEKKKLFLKLEPDITFSNIQVRPTQTNQDIVLLQKQVEGLEAKIRILGQKFLLDPKS